MKFAFNVSGSVVGVMIMIVASGTQTYAQCPALSFTSPATACLNQSVSVSASGMYAQYDWDFCAGDLGLTPTAAVFLNTANTGGAFDVELIEESGNYYGFYMGRSTGKMFRLDFGADITSLPTIVDLGALGVGSQTWLTVKIVKEGNTYYGFIIDFLNKVYRISFTGSIKTQPSNATLLYSGGLLNTPIDLDVVSDGSSKYAFVANLNENKLVRMSFGSFSDPITSVVLDVVTVTGSGNLAGVSFAEDCSTWYAITTSISGGNITKIQFTNGLSDPNPVVNVLSGFGFSPASPAGVELVLEDHHFYAFAQAQQAQSDLYRLDFGGSLSNNAPTGTNLGNFGVLSGVFGFSMHKVQSKWLVLSSENGGTRIFKSTFPNNCFSATEGSTAATPTITPTQAGLYSISLNVRDAFNHLTSQSNPIQILNAAAPDLNISNVNNCANNNVNFSAGNVSGDINSYAWDFGDGNNSASANPVHIYNASGAFDIQLNVGALNGCLNQANKTLTIFNPPMADFSVPTPAVACTNQNFTFTNLSTFDAGSNTSWQWSVNGSPVATTQDLMQSFNSVATQQIKLVASLPGCSSQVQKNFNVQQPGPVVDFTMSNGCQASPLQFTNTTAGANLTYAWDFGDGNSSTQTNPVNTYSSFGIFSVNLIAVAMNGCQNSNTKPVAIHSSPQTDFLLALPPFSCSGSPSQFNDATPNPTDSNLSSWSWTFGDPSNGVSSQRNPLYLYTLAGPYTVGLNVTTNFGCSTTIQKIISISQSPVARFSNTPACVNQGTQFTDASTGTIKSWVWQVDNNTYTFNNPIHVFSAMGNYDVKLTVTENNGCVGQTLGNVSVPVGQSPDFSASGTCATKPAIFQDESPVLSDTLVSFDWDFGGQGIGTGSLVQFTFPVTGNYSVKMDAHAKSGCVYAVTKTVAIVSPPLAGFTASTEAGAAPLYVQFTNTSQNATSFLWHFNDASGSKSQVSSPSFTFNDLGDYVVDLDAMNVEGCIDTYSKVIRALVTEINAGITDLQIIPDPVTGQQQVLFVVSNLGNLNLTNPAIEVEISGNTKLKQNLSLVVPPGQSMSQILTYSISPDNLKYVCLRIEVDQDIDPSNDRECATPGQETVVFAPYPNPIQGELHLDWIASGGNPASFTIYNATGAKTFFKELESIQTGLNQIRIDVSSLAAGVYLLNFSYSGTKKTFRFIVN